MYIRERVIMRVKMYSVCLAICLLTSSQQITASFHSLHSATPPLADVLDAIQTAKSTEWAVEVTRGQERAREVAEKFGLYFAGQIGNLGSYYHLRMLRNTSWTAAPGKLLTRRSVTNASPSIDKLTWSLSREPDVGFVEQQVVRKMSKRDFQLPNDPKWPQQWSLLNSGQTDGPIGQDLNVEPVWVQGITGHGVVAAVVDEGIEKEHLELTENYDPLASYDFVNADDNPDPDQNVHEHGTACAGIIAMAKDNDLCGVGVAYNGAIGGLKLDLDHMSDLREAAALGYHNDHIDVYSVSWGPPDFGFMTGKPGPLLARTLQSGVRQGRDGKGVVYVWAAGNGGRYFDSCSADGYSSSVYTISVGSADEFGRMATYDEQCSSKMAVTFSYNSDKSYDNDTTSTLDLYNQITTASHNSQCRNDFTGTSASAPLLSGVVTLALQANSNLTWRDVQYLIAYTSDSSILQDMDWKTNGAGLNVSHKFGFGAVDAEALVTRAQRWINVPSQQRNNLYGSAYSGNTRRNQPLTVYFDVSQSSIGYLEHVLVKMSLNVRGYSREFSLGQYVEETRGLSDEEVLEWLQQPHPRRGDIKIDLTSPQGTVSHLLPYRPYDFVNNYGYSSWPFMSVHHWGENPIGRWTLTITFNSFSGYVSASYIQMIHYGVRQTPVAVSTIPSHCDSACRRQCSDSGQNGCDACRNLRVASTLECVDVCPEGTERYKRFCTVPTQVIITTGTIHSPAIDLTQASITLAPHTDLMDRSTGVAKSVKAGMIGLGGVVMVMCSSIGLIGGVYLCYRRRKKQGTEFHILTSDSTPDLVTNSTTSIA